MSRPQTSEGQIGSLTISALMVLAGVVTLWDTQAYADRDSQVFPQTVATLLIITALGSLVWRLLHPSDNGGFGGGIWWRRILLVAALFACAFTMPMLGFLASGAIAFAGGLIAAMHDRWDMRTALIFGLSGAVVMTAFYALFKFVLLVPLP
ncbi:tripartite tricarboxylate transporter TctB family protein [Roseovarius sp. C7]|uniref:tripartite tricarboxylate transporter TctB family protein n=1 Tax=Roseovarius sp. C7 TaxID=3398643 RepID=UPI0039F5BF53